MSVDWMSLAQSMRDELIARRRDFHQHPELAFEEVRTAGIVARELSELGLEVTTGLGKTGVVGVLDGAHDGPTVLVRCDMDALPIKEANTTEYISETPGKMHACGHDGHTAIGLAVAKMMAGQRENIAGRIKFVFQPAEEIGQGAAAMVKDGVMDNPKPDVSLGLHLWNDLPVGEVSLTPGPAMASADTWKLILRGAGGHGASPHQTRDPIVAGAQIVSALQTIVSRNVPPLETAVVSATRFRAGDADNVIPSEALITGTLRTYTPEVHELVMRRLHEIVMGIASAMQCEAELQVEEMTLAVVNDPAITARVQERLSRAAGSLKYRDDIRTMGAEDMSEFLTRAPGVFMFVGSANQSRDLAYPHHHPRFDFDENALPISAGLLATAIADYVLPEA